MKKQWNSVLMVMVLGIFLMFGSAMAANTVPYSVDDIREIGPGSGHTLTSLRDAGDKVEITWTNVRFSPSGENVPAEQLKPAAYVALYSGNMDAKGVKEPFAIVPVIDGKATCSILNGANKVGVPVAESIWGRAVSGDIIDESMSLVHDPLDPWVIAYDDDLNKLAVWFVMYPGKPTVPAKPIFGNKPVQGKHPELVQ